MRAMAVTIPTMAATMRTTIHAHHHLRSPPSTLYLAPTTHAMPEGGTLNIQTYAVPAAKAPVVVPTAA